MDDKLIYKSLHQKLSQFTEIPLDQWNEFEKHLRVDQYQKNSLIFSQGDSDARIYFVVSGISYSFYGTQSGNISVKNFYWPGRVISPWVSFHLNEPCSFSTMAIQDSVMVSILVTRYKDIEKTHICWLNLSQKLTLQALVDREHREFANLTQTSFDRYEKFKTKYSEIFNYLPQRLIALYLGITPVSLSRLKSKNE